MSNSTLTVNLRSEFPLQKACLDAKDGLVQHENQLFFHFQRYLWDLGHPENNPKDCEHQRRVESRIKEGLPKSQGAVLLKGKYVLGISPFINNYYHFICDLLPCLRALPPQWTVLLPDNFPSGLLSFLQQCRLSLQLLAPKVYWVEQLLIPPITKNDWNPEKIQQIQELGQCLAPSTAITPFRRVYISRKLVKKRHLVNEEELLPYFHRYGFERLFLERLSIVEQIRLMRETSHLIAPHGAGIVNLLFAPFSTHLLEIRPILSSGQFCFEKLCAYGWDNYEYLIPPPCGEFYLASELLLPVLKQWFPR
ncbi:glycosyltransferase family 61 protein [Deltaproteobacteria bacterium TL4]